MNSPCRFQVSYYKRGYHAKVFKNFEEACCAFYNISLSYSPQIKKLIL